MAKLLHSTAPDFSVMFSQFLAQREEIAGDVRGVVSDILAQIRAHGDDALIEYTQKFDRIRLPSGIALTQSQIASHAAKCDSAVREALTLAAQRIYDFHVTQKPQDTSYTDDAGVKLGVRWRPISDVGLYVPGGMASYPSSVLMNAIPAKVAGAQRLVMVVPTPDGQINAAVMAAAQIAQIDEIYPIGGAQAVGALSYGTQSIVPVHVIVVPGNAFVAEAKRQVFGVVGIDMVAGPSEILVVADSSNNPRWIAADLLSQAEHDKVAQSILITDSEAFAKQVMEAVDDILCTLPRTEIAGISWRDQGAVIVVPHLDVAPELVNILAPEHLELAIENPEAMAEKIHHAGAIFLGRYTPEAIGDYVAGPSHVLPTSRTARFSSALTVSDFMKRSSMIKCSAQSLQKIAPTAQLLANAEGLHAHALSVALRMEEESV